jgi:hypothetical protein
MSKFSAICDAFGDVYWAQRLSPSEQLAISRFRQSSDMQSLQGAVGNLEAELNEIRQTHLDGLAAQQQIIQQEQLQAHLEEFIYSVEKLVKQFGAKDCDVPLSVRYFNLKGVRDAVEQQGIGTIVIRGRENKAAFEQVMAAVQQMLVALEKNAEVKEALAWAEKENQRQQVVQQQTQAKKEVRRQQITARLNELMGLTKPMTFMEWHSHKFSDYLNRKPPYDNWPLLKSLPPIAYKPVALFLLWYLPGCGLVLLPIWYHYSKKQIEKDNKAMFEPEIARLQAELSSL